MTLDSFPIGIDLGTTFSTVAVFDPASGKPQVLPNSDGERLTPSAVYITDYGVIQVGTVAVSQARRTPHRVRRWIKRDMGTDRRIPLGDGSFRAEELSAAILAKLVADAEQYLGTPIRKAVVTVPAYFDEPRRKATVDAAAIAGLEEVRLLNEPTAAGLTFGMQERPGETFLVYDLGGGTFDVSVMRSGEQRLEVLSVAGDHHLGGFDFDVLLAQHLAGRFEEEHGFAPGPDDVEYAADWHELMAEAEETKKRLSRLGEVQATIRARGHRSDLVVRRREFEDLIAPYVARTENLCLQALGEADVEPDQVTAVMLVGGSTRIPSVRRTVRTLLPHLDPMPGVNPDEVVAHGAAIRAHLLSGAPAGPLRQVQEITAHPYGVLLKDPDTGKVVNEVLIPKNAPIPHEVRRTFYTMIQGQTLVTAKLTQGDSMDPEEVSVVAATELALPPNRQVNQPIDVTYRYDDEARMHCDFIDRETGLRTAVAYGEGTTGSMPAKEVEAARTSLRTYEIS
ncbi:MAG TPA: Hsp70 family protein [Planctomycetota bacterium]